MSSKIGMVISKSVFTIVVLLLSVVGVVVEVQAQEEPTILIPTLVNDTSLRARQDVCSRFRAYDRGEVELRLALEGLSLRPLFTNESFFHLDPNTGKLDESYNGMIPKLMDELGKRAGFTWRESFGVTSGPPEGYDWTDLLLWGTDYYDVYCDWYSRTIDRLKLGVTFPQGFFDSSYILVAVDATDKEEDNSINLWQWIEPFEPSVWYCIAATIIVSGVLYQLLDYIPPNHVNKFKTPTFNDYRRKKKRREEHDRSQSFSATNNNDTDDYHHRDSEGTTAEAVYEGAHTIGDGIFLSSLLFTQHFQFMPRTTASRIFSASMGFWALLISSNYTANLASFFVIENTPSIAIQSIDDAIQTGQFICVWGGTAPHDFMLKEHPKAKLLLYDDQMSMFAGIRNRDCVLGVSGVSSFERMSKLKESNPDCNLRWVGRILKHVPAGFSVKADAGNLCSSLINDVLNLHLMEMESDGFIDQVWKAELARTQDQDCDRQEALQSGTEDGDSKSRTLKEMAGTFVIHLFFGIVAVIVAITNRFYNKYQRMSDESRHRVLDQIRLGGQQANLERARKETREALEGTNPHDNVVVKASPEAYYKPHDDVAHIYNSDNNHGNTRALHDDSEPEISIPGPLNTAPKSHYSSGGVSSNNNNLTMEERLEVMERTFRARQDELESTLKDQMNAIVSLLKDNPTVGDSKKSLWT